MPHDTVILNVITGEVDCRTYIVIPSFTLEQYSILKFSKVQNHKAITRS